MSNNQEINQEVLETKKPNILLIALAIVLGVIVFVLSLFNPENLAHLMVLVGISIACTQGPNLLENSELFEVEE